MQIKNKLYNPEEHDRFKALSMRQPRADAFFYENDFQKEPLSVDIRSFNTNYRGDLIITSAKKPEVFGHESGATIGIVELYECKPLSEITPDDWKRSGLTPDTPGKYAWFFRNPRPVVPMQVNGTTRIYDLVVPKGDVTEYPSQVYIGEESFNELTNRIRNNGK